MRKGCFYLRVSDVSITGQEDDFPRVDLVLTEDHVLLLAEVPGISRDSLEVKVDNHYVNLRGGRAEPETFAQATHFYKLESFYGTFQRSIKLPVEVDAERAQVSLENGVLRILVPRHRPRVVEIPVE